MYRCATCGVRVIVVREGEETKVIRACAHAEAGVVATISATLSGAGGMKARG